MNITIPELFFEACGRFGDKTCARIKAGNRWQELSYAQLKSLSLKVCRFLMDRGLGKGDTCALALDNRPEWAAIYFGMSAAGVICVPLDTQSSRQELITFCGDSRARLIFCSAGVYFGKIGADFPCPAVVLDSKPLTPDHFTGFSAVYGSAEPVSLPAITAADIASLIYTSGTTGRPKGVLLSHGNLCADALSLMQTAIMRPADNVLSILPLYHSYPFMITMLVPIFTGARVTYFNQRIKPDKIAHTMRESGVSILVGVPQLFALIHARVLARIKAPAFLKKPALLLAGMRLRRQFGPRLRIFASGGSRLNPVVGRDLGLLFGVMVLEGYGLTETSPVVSINRPGKIRLGSVGTPIPGVEIAIGEPSPSGEGEILIRGPNVMRGYYNDPQGTLQALEGGWFHSGDLGYIDAKGFLFVTGRKKEVIVLGSGKNVYPEELEEYYAQGPYIREIFIYPGREERLGVPQETLRAVIFPDFDYFRRKHETNIREKVVWELQERSLSLPPYKRITGYSLAKGELPRTALRKIKRYEAMDRFVRHKAETLKPEEEALTEADKQLLRTPQAKKIVSELSRRLGKPVSPYSNLELDLGLDSLTRVEMELELEKIFSLKIPDDAFDSAFTVRDIVERVTALMERASAPRQEMSVKTWGEILSEPLTPDMRAKVRMEMTALDKAVNAAAHFLLRALFRVFWLLRIREKAPLPPDGPFLLCPNHASYLDGFAVFCSLPVRLALNTYFVGFSGFFEHPSVRWAMKTARLVPINPDTNSTESMKMIAQLLRAGKIVCVFPEGQRSADGAVHEFKRGAGIVLKETGADCLPVYLRSYHAWPRPRKLPRLFAGITVIFGPLIKNREMTPQEGYAAIAEKVRRAVIRTGDA